LERVRSTRNNAAVKESLDRLRKVAADPGANTMPAIVECVKTYATVGEISDALRDVFGTYQEPALF
jgi:methylmalonyl-CoA mutase N-terminal domain/subunit